MAVTTWSTVPSGVVSDDAGEAVPVSYCVSTDALASAASPVPTTGQLWPRGNISTHLQV